MSWMYVAANAGMGLEAQHIRRIGVAPAISLKRDKADDRWYATILETCGTAARVVYLTAGMTVVEAKEAAETAAREAGWKW